MAVIRQKRAQEAVKKQIKRSQTLKKKMETQRKKEDFGEAWRYQLSEEQRKELESVVGDLEAPKLQDSIDINQFFDPINFYRDNKNNKINFDYEEYINAEKAYANAIEDCDKVLRGEDVEEDKSVLEAIDEQLDKEELEEKKKKAGYQGLKLPRFLQSKYAQWTKYFNRFVPLYDRYVCSCCGRPLEQDFYFPQYVETNLARIEDNGKIHSSICIDCCKRIYEYLYFEKADKDPIEAMKWFCSYLNIYFDEMLYYEAKSKMESRGKKNHIVEEYMNVINSSVDFKEKVFMDSKDISSKSNNESDTGKKKRGRPRKNVDLDNAKPEDFLPSGWTKEDEKNRKLVIKMVGYDPFDYESDDNRKQLYSDLLGTLDQGMEMDEIKLQAAIQIVTSYLRVRELTKKLREKEQEGASIQDLKGLSDLKEREMKAITTFSRDNGFGERYAVSKSKGENSFTGIMNKMDEMKYEDELVNMYDIQTSSTIQQAAEASFKAIMGQLSLGEAEVWQTCAEQLKEIEKLRRENLTLTEDLRKTKYELAKKNLIEETLAKGQTIEDDDGSNMFGGY